jgi:Protein of unknown function (DUF4199)
LSPIFWGHSAKISGQNNKKNDANEAKTPFITYFCRMKKTIFIYGVLAGIAAVAYAFLIHSVNRTGFFSMWYAATSVSIYALGMYLTAKKVANAEFKVVLRTAFAVFLIANIVYYVFDFALFNFIDPSFAKFQAELAIVDMKIGTPLEQQIQREEDILAADIHNVPSLFNRYLKMAIGGFGLAVFVAYLIKRK